MTCRKVCFVEEDSFMAIFNKCHALFFGFLVFAIVGAAGYSINQGDYFQHQYTFIVVKSLLLSLVLAMRNGLI